jgi:hypothetical protein
LAEVKHAGEVPEVGERTARTGAQRERLLELGEERLKTGAIAYADDAGVVVNGTSRSSVLVRHRQASISATL